MAWLHVLLHTCKEQSSNELIAACVRVHLAQLWRREDLDFRLKPYLCLSTGNEVGLIEVVLNAETVSSIQQAYGGSTAAFRDTPLDDWIRSHNKDRTRPRHLAALLPGPAPSPEAHTPSAGRHSQGL